MTPITRRHRDTDTPVCVTSRRHFFRTSAAASVAAFARPSALAQQQVRASPKPCPASAWQKHGIVLEATEPWESGLFQNFTTVAEPLQEDTWRLWYSVGGGKDGFNVALAEGAPGRRWKKTPAVLSAGDPPDAPLAIGNLPAGWRPTQAVHVLLRDGRHRIYFWAHGPRIVRYLAAESDDGRRYRVLDPSRGVLYHPHDRAAWGVASPDGVLFHAEHSRERPTDEPLALPRQISNDATNVYQLPDGSFEMYSVALVRVPQTDPAYIAHDNVPGYLRVVDRYASADGVNFETRHRVIQRDADDPADMQFYYLSQTLTPQGRVGMLGHYRCDEQTMDLEWCFSPDGKTWERPKRQAWLPRSEPPAPDCLGIYANSRLVHHGGRWHLFYTAFNSTHNGKTAHGAPRQVVMHASTDSIWA